MSAWEPAISRETTREELDLLIDRWIDVAITDLRQQLADDPDMSDRDRAHWLARFTLSSGMAYIVSNSARVVRRASLAAERAKPC